MDNSGSIHKKTSDKRTYLLIANVQLIEEASNDIIESCNIV